MVGLVRSLRILVAVSALGVSPQALAAGAPSYVRTTLDDDAPPPPRTQREPRRFRTTLDDASHSSFPLDTASVGAAGRLIRVSLDEVAPYGHLSPTQSQARRYRTTLD